MMRRMSRPPVVAALLGLVLLTVAGCARGDDGERGAAAPTTTTTTAKEIPAVPSPGCVESTVGVVAQERRTVSVNGEERWYLLTSPPAHDGATPLPLVVELHG